MAPKQKAVKMSLAEFVGVPDENNTSSWADDMDDYTPRGIPTNSYRSSGGGPSSTTMSGFGNLGDTRARGSGPVGGSMPPQREYRDYHEQRESREPVPLPTQPPFTAHIANLSFQASDEDIQMAFSDLGCKIKNIRVGFDNMTGSRKGFGYIDFETQDDLRIAVENSGVSLVGRSLRINVAEKDQRPVRSTEAPSFSRSMFGSLATREPPASAASAAPAGPTVSESASQWRKASSSAIHTPSDRAPSVTSEAQSAIPAGVSTWRSARSTQPSAGHSPARESSNPPASPAVSAAASAAPAPPKSRQETLAKLLDSDTAGPTHTKGSNPFGDARPVDTVARQRELEERQAKRQEEQRARQRAEREKVAAEKKEAEERRAREAAAKLEEAAQRRRAALTGGNTSTPGTPVSQTAELPEAESTSADAGAGAAAEVSSAVPEEGAAPSQENGSGAATTSAPAPQKAHDQRRQRGADNEDQAPPKHSAAASWRSSGPPSAAATGTSTPTNNSASGEDAGWSTVGPRTRGPNRRGGQQGRGFHSGGNIRRGDGSRQNNPSHRGHRTPHPASGTAAPAAAAAPVATDAPSSN